MTSIEWLALALYDNAEMKAEGGVIDQIVEEAKEMHKQEIIEAHGEEQSYLQYDGSWKRMNGEQYYQETFVSKGSDNHLPDIRKMVEIPKQEISDEEINKEAKNHHNYYEWSAGAKWYREQLKLKQPKKY